MNFGEDTYSQYLGQTHTYKDGQIIFGEGTAGGWIYVVAFGEVDIFKTIDGKCITIDRVYEGECFGEVSFFDRRVRSAGAKASGDCGIMQFDEEFLGEEYGKLPNSFKVIIGAMALRLRRMSRKTALLASHPKICKYLARLETPSDLP